MSEIPVTKEIVSAVLERIQKERDADTKEYKDFRQYIEPFEHWLQSLQGQLAQELHCGIDMNRLIQGLDSSTHSSLLIVTSHDPHKLRGFARSLGNTAFEARRKTGRITPLISFVFDEADEFIPQQDSGTYKESKEIVETLARRGRKFGLGVGIATQRTRYLDTSIMAQPHTYLVSKLPRRTDREVVAEAFGVSEDMFRQTFKFKPGNWLLMSHDATGLKAIPVPIQTEDANSRIREYLENLDLSTTEPNRSQLF